jgi:hypothetical protein
MPPQFNGDLLLGSPYAQYQRVEVTFPSTPDTDIVIKHTLQASNPEDLEYTIAKQDRAGFVYNDQGATRKDWKPGFLYLRCSVASLKATILLTVPRTV